MKVIKLMYLIDRKMIELRDNVITGDRYVSMKYGPVLCNTLNLIKGNSAFGEEYRDNYWDLYITTSDYYLKLDENVNEVALKRTFSEDEIDSIDTVIKEHGGKDEWQLVEYTHNPDNCPEWQDPSPFGVVELPLQRILRFMRKDESVYRKLTFSEMVSSLDVF